MNADRDETTAERYDRNWLDLIQELRVAQTGIQVLAGFLLTVPFSVRFEDIADHDRVLFLVAFGLAVLTIGLMIAPVAMHPGWADTPGVVESLPRFHKLTGPVLRDAAGGADTTVWLSAVDPQPPSGQLWHDRRARSTHLLGRTRTGDAERTEIWDWARDQASIKAPR